MWDNDKDRMVFRVTIDADRSDPMLRDDGEEDGIPQQDPALFIRRQRQFCSNMRQPFEGGGLGSSAPIYSGPGDLTAQTPFGTTPPTRRPNRRIDYMPFGNNAFTPGGSTPPIAPVAPS